MNLTRCISRDGDGLLELSCACGKRLWLGPPQIPILIDRPTLFATGDLAAAYLQGIDNAMQQEADRLAPLWRSHLVSDEALADIIDEWSHIRG